VPGGLVATGAGLLGSPLTGGLLAIGGLPVVPVPALPGFLSLHVLALVLVLVGVFVFVLVVIFMI
jgi:hypothetical protein